MLKITLITAAVITLCLGLLIYFKWFKIPSSQLLTPIANTLADVLGFPKNPIESGGEKDSGKNLLDQTKDSVAQNTQKTIESVKTTVYDQAKTTLDQVFDKQPSDNKDDKNSKEVQVTVLGVNNQTVDEDTYVFDLAANQGFNMTLSLNKKYYFKFKNIPANYCIYISGSKYPITDGTLEIQFTKIGNYSIKANSCELNEKDLGTLTIQ